MAVQSVMQQATKNPVATGIKKIQQFNQFKHHEN